ncbi:MAG: hypothetical protein ACYCY0_07995 [Acidithiobacillus ferrivorans]
MLGQALSERKKGPFSTSDVTDGASRCRLLRSFKWAKSSKPEWFPEDPAPEHAVTASQKGISRYCRTAAAGVSGFYVLRWPSITDIPTLIMVGI